MAEAIVKPRSNLLNPEAIEHGKFATDISIQIPYLRINVNLSDLIALMI
jgi:hypothetical protein